jgi:hypothetical protein
MGVRIVRGFWGRRGLSGMVIVRLCEGGGGHQAKRQ